MAAMVLEAVSTRKIPYDGRDVRHVIFEIGSFRVLQKSRYLRG